MHFSTVCFVCAFLVCCAVFSSATSAQDHYKNFKVAIYCPAGITRQLADPKTLEQQWSQISSSVHVDKVYLEVYRSRTFVDENTIEPIKTFLRDKGVQVSGGVTLAWNDSSQFETFSYATPEHRDECKRSVELAAKHFDEVILDDFFFYCTKNDADIAAKGSKSWTQYRLEAMREASENLVIKPAKAINPKVKLIIKYPNWYEHFQATGYDLDVQAKMFDAIYTGTETRDPIITDQLLQQYESYLVFRYFDNIKPNGGNGGGWVDTFSTRYVDRYAEQLWDTLFANAPEITLFNWGAMVRPVAIGDRSAWKDKPTSYRFNDEKATWAAAAGEALRTIDPVIGKIGKPIGLASYKPYQSSGEDFLHNYLGNIGIPIELYPTFPSDADTVLLTEAAKIDPQIVERIKGQLTAGKNVVITSGLLHALQGKGIEDIVELEYTDHKVAIDEFYNGFGAGNGTSLNSADGKDPAILFPEIRFYTNDSWSLIRGVASAKGFPILLMNKYSKGVLYVLAIPENIGDLYKLPQGVTNAMRHYLLREFAVRIDAPAGVSLFAYDNGTFIVESFRHEETKVIVSVSGERKKIRDVGSDNVLSGEADPGLGSGRRGRGGQVPPPRTLFNVSLQPHSYQLFAIEK